VERTVKPHARIDVARKGIGRGDDRFERGANERIAMMLRPRQRTRVAAQKRKMGRDFLAKRHPLRLLHWSWAAA
jgi:hypothetical protein